MIVLLRIISWLLGGYAVIYFVSALGVFPRGTHFLLSIPPTWAEANLFSIIGASLAAAFAASVLSHLEKITAHLIADHTPRRIDSDTAMASPMATVSTTGATGRKEPRLDS